MECMVKVVVRCNEEIAAAIPGCHLVRLPACDHFPTLRAPEAVLQLVTDLYVPLTSGGAAVG